MTDEKAVVLKKADAPMEWGNRAEIGALADRLAVMLPNAKDLNRDEILTAAQYCRMMDLNPFRGEVYFYKSKGKLTVVDGYKALARWANDKARYSTWDENLPLEDEQVEHVRVWILRDDRAYLLEQYTKLGAKFMEAMQIAAHYADGVVTKSDTVARDGGSKEPPVGWTWRDVARKRAFKNALNLSHGAPSPREIAAMSWTVDGVQTIPEDWDGTEQLTPPEAEQTAKLTAATRETVEAFKRLEPEERQAKAEANNVLLNGEANFEGFDTPPTPKQTGSEWDEALFTAAEPKTEPATEQSKQNGKGWSASDTRDMLEKLLIRANEATAGHYKGTAHLFKTMQLERGKDFAWGNPHDEQLWAGYLGTLVEHIQKEAGQKELPL